MVAWQNVTVKLSDLKPWSENPRTMTKKQAQRLLKSWSDLGQFQTIAIGPLVPNGDGKSYCQVYDGHQRLSALLAAHGPQFAIDARQADRELSDDERRELTVQANLPAGSWNWDALSGWNAAQLQEWGFDQEALKAWNTDAANLATMLTVDESGNADADPQIDRAEELNKKWQVRTGDLWRIGEHRIICGDCLDVYVLNKVRRDERPKIIIADPPYGVNIVAANVTVGGGEAYNIPFGGVKRKGYVGGENSIKARTGHYPIESWKGNKRLRGTVGAAKPFGSQKNRVRGSDRAAHVVDVGKYMPVDGDETTELAIKASSFYLKQFPESIQIWWGANYYADSLKPSMCWLVWDKETTGNFADCELAWVNIERAAKLFRHRWNGMLRDSERERRWHPTQKPAALAAWMLNEFSVENDVIIDPFAGAGWSIIGAENTRRKARVIEKIPEYCAVILERMATAFPGIEIERIAEI